MKNESFNGAYIWGLKPEDRTILGDIVKRHGYHPLSYFPDKDEMDSNDLIIVCPGVSSAKKLEGELMYIRRRVGNEPRIMFLADSNMLEGRIMWLYDIPVVPLRTSIIDKAIETYFKK